ncbi:hypothetical protein C8Q80DRAFT_1274910 [Daedaleopsis nitida]|nr:hypothetical protein C8Q80DRAFT_1274910 [Daedaleopsis nitida]
MSVSDISEIFVISDGRSIPTDLYLEHNNGFTKNMFAAMGSSASIEHVQQKSSACVEVLRHLSHEMSTWFGVRDFHRRHKTVDCAADLQALCNDLEVQNVHTFKADRRVPPPPSKQAPKKTPKSGVRDILQDGMVALVESNMFEQWLKRTGVGGTDLYSGAADGQEGHGEEDSMTGTAFDNPNGTLEVENDVDSDFETQE